MSTDSKEFEQLVRKSSGYLGVFIPIIPVITACVALYLSLKNKKYKTSFNDENNVGSQSTKPRVNPVIFH
jgi:hypothetical protein